nr:MAG TPA: hypothetical protein [Caudoviricetes sp.]
MSLRRHIYFRYKNYQKQHFSIINKKKWRY